MEQQLENLRTASTWYRCAAQKIVLYMDDDDNGTASKKEELDKIRILVKENAKQEVILKNSCEALDKARAKLDTVPDLDIDQVRHTLLIE